MTAPRLDQSAATSIARRPTTLSASAAELLAAGPMDTVSLMQQVCRVARLRPEAAERMAEALLSRHPEFIRLPIGHWALAGQLVTTPGGVGSDDSSALIRRSSLMNVAFAVVDVETTGTRARYGDRITEIAIVEVRDGAVQETFSQLVNPERPIPSYISALTNISWAMVKHAPTFRQVADAVTSRLAGRVFTAHNAAFDWRFVSEELTRGVGMQLVGPRLCTVRLSRALLPQLARRSLDHVTNYFGISVSARHRASGDAVATAEVLLRLLGVAADRGIDNWDALSAHLSTPRRERTLAAARRRRRAFPSPVREDHSA